MRVTNLSTNEVVISRDNIDGTSFKPSQKLDQGTYTVEVRADLGFSGETDFSEPNRFVVDVLTPPKPGGDDGDDEVTPSGTVGTQNPTFTLSLIHISEPTRPY